MKKIYLFSESRLLQSTGLSVKDNACYRTTRHSISPTCRIRINALSLCTELGTWISKNLNALAFLTRA